MPSSPSPIHRSKDSTPEATGDGSWPPALQSLATASMPDFLLRQRWYPAKDAGRPAILDCVLLPFAVPGHPAVLGVWQVQPPGRAPMHLFVAMALAPDGATEAGQVIAEVPPGGDGDTGAAQRILVEAFSLDAFNREWVAMLLRGAGEGRNDAPSSEAAPNSRAARLRSGQTALLADCGLESDGEWAIRRSSAEQSNTSIRIGDKAIMKVIRKLEEGVNPELEVGRFLTGEAGFTATPAMLAWADLDGPDGTGPYTLCVVQSFVPNQGDGWDWVLRKLAAAGAEPLAQATAWLRILGKRTAQMHRAFGVDSKDPAFAPEPVRDEDLHGWSEAAHAMQARVLEGLARAGDRLEPQALACSRSLLSQPALLASRLDEMLQQPPRDDTSRGPHGFFKTRHHGDFHLGQVLVTGDDAVIVDFEGEPMRPLGDRRAKHAPLRDVAGLLRSLSYAVAAASRGVAPQVAGVAREAALDRLQQWELSASRAFLDAYFSAAAGTPGIPADRGSSDRLLRFFLLEKALYEVSYELANRPDWVEIPLRGILALLQDGLATRSHRMPFGAQISDDGAVRFRLWAPSHASVRIELDGNVEALAMQPAEGGWHELVTGRARAGTQYRFVLPDGMRVPDPASRYQPQDVHGPSEVVDPRAYKWCDAGWKGRAWEEAVVYELHVGAFSPQGTFGGVAEKLDHLVSLGVTAIELMPVADFPGRRNWGYDGVLPYAPDAAYGRPEDFKALVDAAHARGLMVLLDVVYNHFGPEGAYLHTIAPQTFTDRHQTPWGAAINTDGADSPAVRDYFIHNALYWIEEFHLDGLRLDAVHAILDDGPRHLLVELAERVRAAAPDRFVHLVLENEENQAHRLVRDSKAGPRSYTAQWNDDVHHVLHVAATGEAHGYYGDYHADTRKLGRALAEGFAFQGEVMPYRGHERGEPSAALPPTAFVAFMQNHDQVGNRAFGERLTAIAPHDAVRAVAAVYLLLPQVPMLFMGEEWAAAQPFPFFCDFGPELADAVRNGRREEFARFPEFQDPAMRERIPDPVSAATFESAKLGWEDRSREPHAGWLDWYRRVLAVRRAEIVPLLGAMRSGGRFRVVGDGAVVVRWRRGDGPGELVLAANLSAIAVDGFPPAAGPVIWREGDIGEGGQGHRASQIRLGAWSVRWTLEAGVGGSQAPTDPENAELSDEASPLELLAHRMGIEGEFRDARGAMVQTDDQTRRRLLEAMGVPAADDLQVQEALENLERAAWSRPLPPVQVSTADEHAIAVPVVQGRQTRELAWRLELEEGGERSGRAAWDQLDLLDEHMLDGNVFQRRRLPLCDDLPWGYHRLTLAGSEAAMTVVVTPGRCWLPPALAEGKRLWGIAAQLYLLRSDSDWGIGDFGDLRSLVDLAAERRADVIGLNPLHAMFQDNPGHASPYSPASRLLLNVLNIDVTAVPELADCPEASDLLASPSFQRDLEDCRAQRLVDYVQVNALKMPVLQKLFEACRDAAEPTRWRAFQSFRRELGEVLERNCLYLALRDHFARAEPACPDWREWPQEFRDPDSAAVASFAQEHRQSVDFLAWLQWVADGQLGAAAAAAEEAGMAVGLYRDLAVGSDRAGAETWVNSAAVVSEAQVGAPPDIFNPAGQAWGLPPFQPNALRDEAYRSFVDLIRVNMRHAGGLRIDHVMGLQHLYWVPAGQAPSAGAYVRYPMADMVGILALESHRQRCLVVGEDLGTVPEGFRERMQAAGILSYRVLFFEQDGDTGAFTPPDEYPSLALAVIGSHDLPTLRGWWEGRDLEIKAGLGLFPSEDDAASQHAARRRDREALLKALRDEDLLGPQETPDVADLSRRAHAFLARSPSLLAMVQLDDLTDESEPVNVPATSEEHPNWRRRHSLTLEDLATCPEFEEITAIMHEARAGSGRQVRTEP